MNKPKVHYHVVKTDKAERTPQGFLRMPAYLTRTGVFKYRMKDGSILRELRHPDDVFLPESLKTLAGVPLTNEHPTKLVSPESLKKDVVGWVGETIEKDMIYLKALVTIADAKAIDEVESGKQELSCGYTADLVEEKGFYNGEEYDVRQTNIVYNHVSLVKKGRAGANVRLHLDAESAEYIGDGNDWQEDAGMAKVKLGDMEFECSKEMADAFESMMKKKQQEMDSLSEQMKDMCPKADYDKMKSEYEKVSATKDMLETQVNELKTKKDGAEIYQEKFQAAVKARVALVTEAKSVVKADVKLDEMTDLEVKKAVVTEKFPKIDLKEKSDDYVQAMFDHAIETHKADLEGQKNLKSKTPAKKTDSQDEVLSADEARKKAIEESLNAWKKKA